MERISPQSCSWGCSAGQCLPEPVTTLTFTMTPLLIQKGHTVTVSWSTSLIDSCSITSNNSDSWTDTSGTKKPSKQIMGQTIFTASCISTDGSILTQSATVNLVPVFCGAQPGADRSVAAYCGLRIFNTKSRKRRGSRSSSLAN